MRLIATALLSATLLAGCQAASGGAYDQAITCVSATDALIAGAKTVQSSPADYERVRGAWFTKAVTEGKKLGRDESDIRADLAKRLDARLAAMRNSDGQPDPDRILTDLKQQNEQLQHCRTPA